MSFLTDLPKEDRDLVFDLARHEGMRVFHAYINGRSVNVAERLLDDSKLDTMVKVQEMRGMRKAYRTIAVFFDEIKNWSKKHKNKQDSVPSGE